jgi:hypothetical protein
MELYVNMYSYIIFDHHRGFAIDPHSRGVRNSANGTHSPNVSHCFAENEATNTLTQ